VDTDFQTGENKMKRYIGKAIYYAMLPFVGLGMIAYLVAAACMLGWGKADEHIGNWNK
jgi:hypothetical protein